LQIVVEACRQETAMGMDIARPERAKRKKRNRILMGIGIGVALVIVTVALAQLEPAPPSVDRAAVWVDTVKRGEMLRQVRGPGTLVPEEIQWISAHREGQIERIAVLPGTEVKPDTLIMELSNPELQQQALEAESQLKSAEASYKVLEAQLQSQLLNQEAEVAGAESEYNQAQLQVQADEELAREDLLPALTLKLSRLRASQLEERLKIEKQRLERTKDSIQSQLAAERTRLEQLRSMHQLRQEQVRRLDVRAGMTGVLQEVPVEVGQRVSAGTILARVAQPDQLKAELRIPETQAKDLVIGQKATIDTRNGLIDGRVKRIDPSVREGTVTVDVELLGELPKGARPDLSVDGTIEIERLEDVLYVGRPAYGQAGSRIELFKLVEGGDLAVRVPVQLGRSSVNTIEIVEGLEEGDKVILSDTSAWDGFDRLRLD
jgi:HlyD family secretion protein